MSPDSQSRINSVIRSLSDIVLPAVRADESLALEQLQLAIGHLAILSAQLDATPDFLARELADRRALAQALLETTAGEQTTAKAHQTLDTILQNAEATTTEISATIQQLINVVYSSASVECQAAVFNIVVKSEHSRTLAERHWFAPMGFDAELSS